MTVDLDQQPSHGRYALRTAVESDRCFIVDLWRESLSPYVLPIYGSWDDAMCDANFTRKLVGGLSIIEVNDERAGVLSLRVDDGFLYVSEIELSPDHRNQGIGTQVMHDVIAYAEAHGLHVELQVLVNNPAKRFYERLGFESTHIKMFRKTGG